MAGAAEGKGHAVSVWLHFVKKRERKEGRAPLSAPDEDEDVFSSTSSFSGFPACNAMGCGACNGGITQNVPNALSQGLGCRCCRARQHY